MNAVRAGAVADILFDILFYKYLLKYTFLMF